MTHLTQALLAVCVFAGVAGADVLRDREQHAWQPVRDDVYLQEVGRKVVTESPVLAVAVCGGKLYAGFENGVRVLDGDALPPMETPVGAVRRLKALNGALYLVTDKGLFRLDGAAWKELGAGDFTDLCLHQGSVVVSVQRELFRLDGDILVPIENAANCPQPILRVASYSETIYCLLPGQLCVFDGKAYDSVNVSDWGKLPSETTRDLMALGSRLMTATDRGVAVLRGMAITALTGADGLCYEDTTCLAPGFAGDFWIGTTRGAIRAVDGEYHYFAADRWLPGDRVYDVACGDRVAYIATDKGLGIVEYEPYTMEKKAAYYERHLEEWGQKRLGFTHKLEWNPAKGGWIREVSDNDVGWSTHYLAAQCFKYAATGDETALKEAINSFHSMKWSEEISSIPGFPARAIWAVGETGHQAEGGSGGYAAEWHRTPDDVWEWKGDTSSDETDAQWYAASIYYDLTADDIEKKRVAQHLERVGGHIADNGWVLRDVDGKPTRWARWDPEYFKSFTGYYARGLNGLEALSYMRATASITGNPKFEEAYKTLLGFGYQDEVLRQKLTFPPDAVFHSDDRLAFYTYYTLLKYETDPYLRGLYLRSLERSYEIERIEHIPWFNFIYGALTGNDCEVVEAVQHLRECPLDLVDYSYRNSHRADLATPAGYTAYAGGTRAVSPRERGLQRWSCSALELDGGSGGNNVVDPAGWLDAYWMGRYYGFIEAPTVTDPALLTVEQRGLQLGAKPYDGPPRPPLEDETAAK